MTSHDNQILLTGGTCNRVLKSHPDLCHHCGYIGAPGLATNVCSGCRRQTHAECVPAFPGGVCDACRFVEEEDARCEICAVADPPNTADAPHDGVHRLVLLAAFHGRRWSPVSEEEEERDEEEGAWWDRGGAERPLRLPYDCEVARRLAEDANALFQLKDLPDGVAGDRPMRVAVGGVTYRSHPMMVHSWCAQSVFQIHPGATGASVWQAVAEGVDSPRQCEFAEACTQHKVGVVNGASGCAFCDSSDGHQIFCYGHTNSVCGCSNCNWSVRPRLTYTSFHASCAVRAGMYRVVDPADGGAGMMCRKSMRPFLERVHQSKRSRKTTRVQRVERWLENSSGFHMDLASRVDPNNVAFEASDTFAVLGTHYTSRPPSLQPRRGVLGPREREREGKRARDVQESGAQVVRGVSDDARDPEAAPRAEDEHADDADGDEEHEDREHDADPQERANRPPPPSHVASSARRSSATHVREERRPEARLSVPRDAELIRLLLSKKGMFKMALERTNREDRGLRSLRELCEEEDE